MIIAYCEKYKNRLQIDGVVRDSGSLFDWYLIGIGMGFSTCCLLVHAQSESDAMDAYADSRYAHLTAIDEKDMSDHLIPERQKAINLMQQIVDEADDSIGDLQWQCDYSDDNLDRSANDIVDWANELKSINWKSNDDLYPNLSYLGNESKPHQLDEIRIIEKIDKSQIHWFHKKTDLSFDPKRSQSFSKEDFIR